jgi:hypothetical protein
MDRCRIPVCNRLRYAGATVVGSACAEFDQGGTGGFGGEWVAELVDVLVFGLTSASCVGLYGGPAQVGQRCQAGQHGREGEIQTDALCFVVGVGGDEALSGLRAGVAAAER